MHTHLLVTSFLRALVACFAVSQLCFQTKMLIKQCFPKDDSIAGKMQIQTQSIKGTALKLVKD